jgi:hypothetical protein
MGNERVILMTAANKVSSRPFHTLVDVSSKPKPPLINHRIIKKETGQAIGNLLPIFGDNCRPIQTLAAAITIIARSQRRDVKSMGKKMAAEIAILRANSTG